MHVTHLDDQSSPLAVSSASPSATRSGETLSWRLARLAADSSNGINQQTPRGVPLAGHRVQPGVGDTGIGMTVVTVGVLGQVLLVIVLGVVVLAEWSDLSGDIA